MARPQGQTASQQGGVVISKLGAAQRQLDAAIRMSFSKEDDLAIHTVAAAAYGILRDILSEGREPRDLENQLRAGVYEFARSLARGETSDTEADDLKHQHPQLYPLIAAVAEEIRVSGDEVTPDDVPFSLSKEDKIRDRRAMVINANFLKHADHDPDAHLPLEKLDNDTLLMRACVTYVMVLHTHTVEMEVFYIFWSLAHENRKELKGAQAELADNLAGLSPSRRRRACARIIRACKKRSKWATTSHLTAEELGL